MVNRFGEGGDKESARVRDWVVCNETDLFGGGGRRAMRQASLGELGGGD